MDKLTQHRKKRLAALVDGVPYAGNQQAFAKKAKLSKGRISQMLDPDESFGERAAKKLALQLNLGERYFEDGFQVGTDLAPQAEPPPMCDGARFLHWLGKIEDPKLMVEARNAAMQLIFAAGEGQWPLPPEPPTPAPDRVTKIAFAARPSRAR